MVDTFKNKQTHKHERTDKEINKTSHRASKLLFMHVKWNNKMANRQNRFGNRIEYAEMYGIANINRIQNERK